jgi:large subunit ribosomal protein L17
MRHRVSGHHLGRAADQRKALLRALTTELLRHEEIITSVAKAKALRPEVERIITKGKKGHLADFTATHKKGQGGDEAAAKQAGRSLHLRRQVGAFVYDEDVVAKLFNEIAPRYADRKGGYTRIIKAGFRRGDAMPQAIIQLV